MFCDPAILFYSPWRNSPHTGEPGTIIFIVSLFVTAENKSSLNIYQQENAVKWCYIHTLKKASSYDEWSRDTCNNMIKISKLLCLRKMGWGRRFGGWYIRTYIHMHIYTHMYNDTSTIHFNIKQNNIDCEMDGRKCIMHTGSLSDTVIW